MTLTPLWWRIVASLAILGVTIGEAHGVANRIVAGVLMAAASGVLFGFASASQRLRPAILIFSSAAGLAACFFSPSGIAEVPVFLSASRVPDAFDGEALRWFTIVDAIAVGVTLACISHSLPAAMAGIGVPLLVQRSLERRELVRERDRAQALLLEVEAGRDAETQAAALRERGRIAREMHDVLAHSLAGLSVQLQAVRAVATREDVGPTVLEPLDRAAVLARDGLAEARAVVSTLRDPVGLGLDALPALVERHPGEAEFTVAGSPGSVRPEAGHAIYRAVQEALTNAARYAPGSPVRVELVWGPDVLGVTVADDGPAPERTAVRGQGSGLGLAGMTERIQQVGGTLQAGPHPGGGWAVSATVPATEGVQ